MRWPCGLALVLFAAPAAAEVELLTYRYQCERGVEVPVTYVNSADGSAVVLNVEGRQISLLQAMSGSGARYEWPSDGSGYVWWSKGDGAMLLWHDAAGEETTLLKECRAN